VTLTILGIVSVIVSLIAWLIKRWLTKRDNTGEGDAKILEKQRDNNVINLADADKLLNKLREEHKQ